MKPLIFQKKYIQKSVLYVENMIKYAYIECIEKADIMVVTKNDSFYIE